MNKNKCINNPNQLKCETGSACNYCNIIIHIEQLHRDVIELLDRVTK